MLICSICGDVFDYHAPCDRTHHGTCHWCAEHNLAGSPVDHQAHTPPVEAPSILEAYARRVLWEVPAWPRTVEEWMDNFPAREDA